MWLKKIRRDRKEPPPEEIEAETEVETEAEAKTEKGPGAEKEAEAEVEPEVKETTEEVEPPRKPDTIEREEDVVTIEEEPESPKTPDAVVREFLHSREAPFTIRMLTRGTGLSLKDAKAALKTLISTEEVGTRTFGKAVVYWRTGRFKPGTPVQKLREEMKETVPEELQHLMDKITLLEQEKAAQAREYEALQTRLKEMESKESEPSEEQLPPLQERISALEAENKRLLQDNQQLKAQLVGFQTKFAGKETEWKAVAERMAEEMAARAGTSTEEVLRFFEAPGHY